MSRLIKYSIHLLSLILSLSVVSSNASTQSYPKKINFRNIMQNQDLALGEVESIIQDHEGFMWLGGRNALLRYDGYDFLSVMIADNLQDLSQTSPINQVIEIFEDSRQDMWVATRSGLFKYDRTHEILARLTLKNVADVPLTQVTVNALAEAPTGEILAGSTSGLTIIEPKTLNFHPILDLDGDNNSTTVNAVHDLFVDKQGIVWIGIDEGVARLDWATKKLTLVIPNPLIPASIADNGIKTIAQDHNGDLWFGADNGIYRLNKASDALRLYQNNPNDRYSLANNMSRQILVDNNGWVWTGSDQGGISLYDQTNDRFIRFQHEEGRAGSLSSNTIRRIYQDMSGDIWVGTYPSGVNFYDRSTSAITVYKKENDLNRGLLDNNVEAVEEDKDGNLWIGAGGVTRYEPGNETFTHYQHTDNSDSRITSTSIMNGVIDSDGDIRFGSWAHGILAYNPKTDSFVEVPADPTLVRRGIKTSNQLNDHMVWSVYEDKRKNLWISTHFSGLTKYDKQTGIYTYYSPIPNDPTSLSNIVVWTAFEDSSGRFWVGTSSGLNLMDRDKETFKRYLSKPGDPHSLANDSILSIYEDKKGRLWFGTDAGLYLFHPETDGFSVYNTEDGFTDNGIRAIIEDQLGNLWLGTNNGVVMFNADSKIVRNYMRYNGEKIGGIATGAAVATHKGEMVFGAKSGLYIFDVNKLTSNEKTPPLALIDFRIFTKKILSDNPDKILTKVVNQTDSITLDYTKSMISFSFSALNYRDSDKNQYAYKLEGFDDRWREVGNQRTALYTNLDAGNYIFRVKASNNDGVWNEVGKSIQVNQLPPPWKTWWADTIYVLVIIAMILQFIHSQRKKRRLIEAQNRLLEIKVAERTTELREKNNDIQAMLSNMRQGLFTVEVNGNIHPEYSHFLEDIFETTDIAGRNAMNLLFGHTELGSDTLDSIKVTISSIIGEDKINYELNVHLLPTEYEANFAGKRKYLSLDWNFILIDHLVSKLMVSVRDVTQLKQLEHDALIKKRELDIIGQLLNIPAKKYLIFATATKRFIAENRDYIQRNEQRSDTVIALLFRNMHTIKGNCRTFGFRFFSDVAHEVESVYSALKTDSTMIWDREQLFADLARVENLLLEYEYVYYTILRRGDRDRDHDGFWADSKAIATIQRCIDTTTQQLQQLPTLKDSQLLLPIQTLLNAALSTPLSEMLSDVVASLPSLAVQLNKDAPKVVIIDNNVRIKASASELITNIFAHILRNCIDHGIETPSVRVQIGKPTSGIIEVRAAIENERLHLHVKDDGQGINIERLFQKGVETGQWTAGDRPSDQEIANLIFISGISTKEQVTNISGRGVGMDAVKQFLCAQDANIILHLFGRDTAQTSFPERVMIPFELIIDLPPSTFTEVA
jgi:ligand-binding sensor domain-containing protein/HPt (histidine-containing phosphotransfer) domain-containing protein